MARLGDQLTRLATMSPADLSAEWRRVHDGDAPGFSAALLRMGLAYALQTKAHGKLPTRYARRLDGAGEVKSSTAPVLSPGTQLVRSWNGRTVCVTVVDGGFEWDGKIHRSLTAIAREVTGAGWSGPRFFGLTERG